MSRITVARYLPWALLCLPVLAVCAILMVLAAPAHLVSAGISSSQMETATPTVEVYDPNKPQAIATPTLLPQATREALFDEVWRTVEENYLYEDYHGKDWEKLYDEYRPKAISAKSAGDYYKAIEDMVGELKDDHSVFFPPPAARYDQDFANGTLSYAGIGITEVYTDSSLLVLYTFPNSPAALSGIKVRDRITAIDGQPIGDEKERGERLRVLVTS